MRICAINQSSSLSFRSTGSDFLEKFHEKTKNSADMTDTILVPRTIFKGYLGIMSGTTLVTLGALLGRFKSLSKTLSITGLLASLYGTYAFVRPYIIKDAKGVATTKDK
jgi:hypothetical protein